VATYTVRPNSTPFNSGVVTNGSPSPNTIEQAVSDSSDATSARLVAGNNAGFSNGFAAPPALPARAQIRSVTPRVRAMDSSQLDYLGFTLQVVDEGVNTHWAYTPILTNALVTYYGPAWTTQPNGAAWAEEDLADLRLSHGYVPPAGTIPLTAAGNIDWAEVYLDIVTNEAPVATITSGASFATARPTWTWSYSDPENDSQERYWVKIFTDAQHAAGGFDPDVTTPTLDLHETFSAATTATATADLPDGTYWLYVKVADAGSSGRYGAYATQSFVITTAGPAVPVVSATADTTFARNIISVQGSTNMVTQNQADVETNTTGFVAITNNTITRSTTVAANGVASLRMSSTAAGTMTAGTLSGVSGLAVRANALHTVFAKLRAGASARTCRIGINFWDLGGVQIGTTTWSAAAVNSTSAWTIFTLAVTTPANAVTCQIVFEVQSTGGAAELHYADMIGIWPGTSTTWTRGGLPFATATTYIVESSDDAGATWAPIRGSPFLVTAPPYSAWVNSAAIDTYYQTLSFFDYEMHAGVARIYRARATAPNELALSVSSASSASTSPLTFTPVNWIVKDPLTPANNILTAVLNLGPEKRSERMGIFYALGRSLPIVVGDTLSGWNGKVTLTAITQGDVTAIERILGLQTPVLIQSARGEHRYVRFTNDRTRTRKRGYNRVYDCDAVEVDTP
jgi:hypothetical protein